MKHNITPTANIQLVILPGDATPKVSSRTIAEAFGKNHKEVLRRISALQTELPQDFSERNFAPAEYFDEQNKPRPHYLLTRDAFSLVVMGFSGKEALNWKIRYIEAFNALEQELLSKKLLATPEGAALIRLGLNWARRLNPARRREIKKAKRYEALGLCRSEIARLLKCGETKIRNLLQEAAWLEVPHA